MSDKKELLSISKLAFRFDLDRQTVRKRLEQAGIEPTVDTPKEKLYELTPEVERAVRNISPMDEAKLRKIEADAEKSELTVKEKKGELVSVYEVKEELQKIFSRLQREFAVQMPKKLAPKLAKAKSAAEIQKILQAENGKIFDSLRTDYTKFL